MFSIIGRKKKVHINAKSFNFKKVIFLLLSPSVSYSPSCPIFPNGVFLFVSLRRISLSDDKLGTNIAKKITSPRKLLKSFELVGS